MASELREFATSSNGDRWLSRNPDAPERRALLQLIGSLAASTGS
jgi:hypothetical protein